MLLVTTSQIQQQLVTPLILRNYIIKPVGHALTSVHYKEIYNNLARFHEKYYFFIKSSSDIKKSSMKMLNKTFS